MAVSQSEDDLLEVTLGYWLIQFSLLLDELKEITAACVFHYEKHVLGTLEHFE